MYEALMHIFSESLLWPPWYHIFIVLFLLSFSISLIMKTRKERAHLPPSPPSLPIIGNLHQLGNLPHRSLWKLSAKYGPVMLLRLGKIPTLIVSSPETAKEVLKTNDLDCCSRPYSHGAMKLTYNLVDVAFGPYSDYWREIRKLFVQELLSAKRVQSFHYIREQEVASLVNELSKVSTNPVMLNEKIFDLTNNIICNIAFGKSYEGKQFRKYKFDKAIEEAMAMLRGFWATDFFPCYGRIIDGFKGLHRRLEKCFSDYDAFFGKIIEEHLSDPETPKAERENIIDILLGLSEDETAPVRISRNHIKSILFVSFLGS